MNCKECGEKIEPRNDIWGRTFETLVGYSSPPGHNHDDNCLTRIYVCKNGHSVKLSLRRRCQACDWTGKEECFCHPGKKLDEWPTDSLVCDRCERVGSIEYVVGRNLCLECAEEIVLQAHVFEDISVASQEGNQRED